MPGKTPQRRFDCLAPCFWMDHAQTSTTHWQEAGLLGSQQGSCGWGKTTDSNVLCSQPSPAYRKDRAREKVQWMASLLHHYWFSHHSWLKWFILGLMWLLLVSLGLSQLSLFPTVLSSTLSHLILFSVILSILSLLLRVFVVFLFPVFTYPFSFTLYFAPPPPSSPFNLPSLTSFLAQKTSLLLLLLLCRESNWTLVMYMCCVLHPCHPPTNRNTRTHTHPLHNYHSY